jgi:glycosyltransferase involved in cell wall biosynthesis
MKILAYISGFDGCGLFRIQIPFKYLAKQGHLVRISHRYDEDEIKWADLVIIQKQYQDAVVPYVQLAQSLGKPVIFEYDDLMTDIPEWNSAHDFYKDKKQKILNFIKMTDACTVSTDYLKKVNQGINPNIHVLPNSMDLKALEENRQPTNRWLQYLVFKDPNSISRVASQQIIQQELMFAKLKGRVKVIWWGSPTHSKDLAIIDKTLAALAKKYPDVAFVKVGCCTADFLKLMKPFSDQIYVLDPIPVHHFHTCLQYLVRLGPTISVCPIVNLPFNYAKSNLKVIESFSLGAACVASNIENYAKTITHGVNGFLASDEQDSNGIAIEWYQYIESLIKDHLLHNLISENGRRTAEADYDISKNYKLWEQAYLEILGGQK